MHDNIEDDSVRKRRKEPVYRCLKRVDKFLHSIATGDWEVDSLHAEVHEACHAYVSLPYPAVTRPAAPAGVEELVKHYGFVCREAENVADPASVNREAESAYQAILDAWPQPSADMARLVNALEDAAEAYGMYPGGDPDTSLVKCERNLDAARAALLNALAAKDAEIERWKKNADAQMHRAIKAEAELDRIKAARVPDELRQALSAIAAGYPIRVHGDRYISVINPYYQPDDGSDRNLVIDINSLLISETVPAPAQGETITAIADRVVAALTSDEAVEAVLAELRRRDWVDAAGAPNDTMRDDARAALQAAAKAIRGEA